MQKNESSTPAQPPAQPDTSALYKVRLNGDITKIGTCHRNTDRAVFEVCFFTDSEKEQLVFHFADLAPPSQTLGVLLNTAELAELDVKCLVSDLEKASAMSKKASVLIRGEYQATLIENIAPKNLSFSFKNKPIDCDLELDCYIQINKNNDLSKISCVIWK